MDAGSRAHSLARWPAMVIACLAIPATSVAQGPARWTVDSVPSVSIGKADGPDAYVLVNPLVGLVLSDGTVVVQNSLRSLFEIRYFNGAGKYLTTVSRWGQGPYEFQRTIGFYRLGGDSIMVLGDDGRLAVWGPTGDRVRESRLDLTKVMPAFTAVGVDARHAALLKSTGPGMPSPGIQRSSATVFMLDLTNGDAQPVADIRERATFYEKMDRGVRIYSVPFATDTWVVGGGGLLWIGDSGSNEIRGYRPGADGPVVVVQSGFDASPVTSDDRRRMRDLYSAMFSGDTQKRWARYAGSMEFPDRTPFFGQLKSDRFGDLWVQEYDRPWKEGPQRWKVYSPKGEELAEVSVPPAAVSPCSRNAIADCRVFSGMMDVGPDYLLVRRADQMGVAHIEKFEVHHDY